jgi:cytoskeletal protein RodZ
MLMDFQSSFIVWLVFLFFFGVLLYVYFAAALMIIARKTKTQGAGLAWIPILNLYLMCQIGRRPAWWMFLFFVPLVNLFALAMIWMSIAETCGKPAWTGALAIIPFVGLAIPAYLAFGAKSASGLSFGARNCQTCGNQIVADESFCRNCGESAATVVAKRRAPIGQTALISAAAATAVLLFSALFGWFFLSGFLAYSPPERKPPALPERTSGTLTEFPGDTDTNAPLAPESVVAEDLQNASQNDSGASGTQTAKRLPPGVNRENLKRRGGTALTTTIYRRPKSRQPATPNVPTEEIYICVLRITPGQADALAADIIKVTGGTRTGARVQSARGTYIGSKIQTTQILIYVLEKQGADTLIFINSPNSATHDAAIRLAGNVGNGEGLNDYPETQNAIWTLPQQKPADLVLIDFNTVTRADLGLSDADLNTDDKTDELPPTRENEKPAYIGCYKDTSAYDLDGFLERSRSNTPERCIATCRAKGFKFAGVQYSESCLCGNSYGKYGAADNCNMRCTGDSSQICGGYSSNGVYSTGVGDDKPVETVKNTSKNSEEQQLIDYFSQFLPERATRARYQDAARRDWEVMIYDYDSTRRAWNTWLFLSWTVGLSGESVSLRHGGGIYADTGDGRVLIFQKGPYLIVVFAPTDAAPDKLISLGNGFQV